VLVCHTLQRQHDAIDAIARGARAGPLPRERLAEAAARVETLQKFARPAAAVDPAAAPSACATEEHRRFAAQLKEPESVAREQGRDPTEPLA
jgi:hypothetical protein